MKEIYRFTLNKKETVEELEKTTNEKGEEVSTKKKVEKDVPYIFVIKRPTRSQNDESEIFRAATESELIRRGVISANLLEKRILNDGGVFTESEKKEKEQLAESFKKFQAEYVDLNKIKEEDRTEEQKSRLDELLKELGNHLERLNELDNAVSRLFNRTAEFLARNKTALWLTLMLSHKEKDGKLLPVFGEGDYEKRLKAHDEMLEKDDDWDYSLVDKLLFNVNIWYLGRAVTKDDFDSLNAIFEENKKR